MSTIEKLKTVTLKLRKERSDLAATMQFHLSEVNNIGKKNGNRETTEEEAIRCIQKALDTVKQNIEISDTKILAEEKAVLESLLPTLATDEEVKEFLSSTFSDTPANKGIVMKALRGEFGVLVDMKHAGIIASQLFGF